MFCRNCGTQMNETMPCPNCGWQRTTIHAPSSTVKMSVNVQQLNQISDDEYGDVKTVYIPDEEAINNIMNNIPINSTTEEQIQFTTDGKNINKQPDTVHVNDTDDNQVQFTSVNNNVKYQAQFNPANGSMNYQQALTPVSDAVNYHPRKSSDHTSQIFIYITGIFIKLLSYVLFTVSFTNLCKSLPDMIISLFGGHTKYYIFLMALSFILRYVSKHLGGSEQFRDTEGYKKYHPVITKILKVLELVVFVWCLIDFISAIISFATGYSAYSYFSSLF